MLKWVLSLTVALVVVAQAGAQPLADRVPGDALIYIGWSGADSMGPGYAGSHLEAVLKESKFSEQVNASLPKVMQKIVAQNPAAAEILPLAASIEGAVWRHPSA